MLDDLLAQISQHLDCDYTLDSRNTFLDLIMVRELAKMAMSGVGGLDGLGQ